MELWWRPVESYSVPIKTAYDTYSVNVFVQILEHNTNTNKISMGNGNGVIRSNGI